MDEDTLIKILNMPFVVKGVQSMDVWQFIFLLSFNLRVCPPSVAAKIVKEGVKKKLLSLTGRVLRPSTSILIADIPLGFTAKISNVEDNEEIKLPNPI